VGDLQNKIRAIWYAERARWILWLPVLLGCGVGWYFALENEPSLSLLTIATLCGVALTLTAHRMRHATWACLMLAGLCVLGGMTLAAWRTAYIAAPIIEHPLYPQMVTGRVVEITTRPDTSRLTLADAHIDALKGAAAPEYITISLRQHVNPDVALGDVVRIKAGFFPPPLPSIPGGYAFNRHFFFKQIGAMGYAVGKTQPEVMQKAQTTDTFGGWIARKRHQIATWLMHEMGMREGSVAAALMVGEAKAIPEDVYEAMRQSGLVHVLSISGLHLTLAAGIFFVSIRYVLAWIPAISLRYDSKKIAAVMALLGTFMYLLIAGMPISAQRSFVMVALVLCAVMLSRTVTPMRSLCLAGFLILVAAPESLLNPGFQLSFAATMAILAYYEHWLQVSYRHPPEEWTWLRKQQRFWGGIIMTSVVATLATTPFILHHFDGFPVYSVLANLLVSPLVSFVIMPLVVLALVLLPLGMAGWLLLPLKWCIATMTYIAEWVLGLPHAVIDLPPLGSEATAVVALGGLWLCLWQTRWRYMGLVAIAAGCASLFFYQAPDMIISADGKKIAVRTAPDRVVMLKGQRDGFAQDSWKRFLRVDALHLRRDASEDVLRCDDMGCIYRWNTQEIALASHRAALEEDCRNADVVITSQWASYHDTRKLCEQTQLFDKHWLAKMRGAAFWITADGITHRTVLETLGNRPWSQR
jgi:competence protein ComEC